MTIHPTDALVTALAAGKSIPEAAAQVGISERTAYRRLAEPSVQQQILQLRTAAFDRAVGQLAHAGAAAVETLVRNLQAPSASVQVRAAAAILALTAKLRATEELRQRLEQAEAAIAEEEAAYDAA